MVIFSSAGTVKRVVTACRQQNPAQRPEFTDIFVLLVGRNIAATVPPPTYLEAAADTGTRAVSNSSPAVKIPAPVPHRHRQLRQHLPRPLSVERLS